jgi:hypothetical protein
MSPDCFRAKIDACVKKTLETKPQLIQISAAWNSREGAPLGRNQYVELEIKKPKPNGASTKLSAKLVNNCEWRCLQYGQLLKNPRLGPSPAEMSDTNLALLAIASIERDASIIGASKRVHTLGGVRKR